MIAPIFEQLSKVYTNVLFLKVDVDDCKEVSQECGIRAMPTFQLWLGGAKTEELVGADKGKLEALIKKYHDSYIPPKGRTLSEASPSSSVPAATTVTGAWGGVDESQPVTTVQFKIMADNSRLVGKFNTSQTVADVRRFIQASRPDLSGAYTLLAGYPTKPVTDNTLTIEAAGFAGAVVTVQK